VICICVQPKRQVRSRSGAERALARKLGDSLSSRGVVFAVEAKRHVAYKELFRHPEYLVTGWDGFVSGIFVAVDLAATELLLHRAERIAALAPRDTSVGSSARAHHA
jgi:hypothetical protein